MKNNIKTRIRTLEELSTILNCLDSEISYYKGLTERETDDGLMEAYKETLCVKQEVYSMITKLADGV